MANKKTTRKIKKHKPVILKYVVDKFEDYERFTTDDRAKAFVFLHLVIAVKETIPANKDIVELINLIDHNSILCVKREDWKVTLTNALSFFAEKELYEKAAECRNLISQL